MAAQTPLVPAPASPRPRAKSAADPVPAVMRQKPLTPWLYLGPALIVMAVFIIYPALTTGLLSLRDKDGVAWAGARCVAGQPCWGILENYRYALTSPIMLQSFFNNLLWIVLMVSATVGLGLVISTLADRVRYEPLAKAIIFMPMAISFVGAGVIWRFVYEYRATGEQIGLLNGILVALGARPVSFITLPIVNTVALIIVGVWMWTGFCMTVLAAALKSVPSEVLEAARVDGATEWEVFSQIMVPMILPTITVVITTMIINVLKVFDIVYVMTGGNYGTEVIANRMYTEQYLNFDTGHAAAIAVVLIVVIIPAMLLNIRRFAAQEAAR
ncbi:MAG: sugar ABC transporter permease [Anaerolineales bacterium]|nr:sugar ABC transporter permease [Anaerolineales bacterium]